jgi:hypothetical protein
MIRKRTLMLLSLMGAFSSGCLTVSISGTGGYGVFQSYLPIDGMAIQLAESCKQLGYDTEIKSTAPLQRTIILNFPSRTGKLILTVVTDAPEITSYKYRYSLTSGFLDHHRTRQQNKLRKAIHKTIIKWRS